LSASIAWYKDVLGCEFEEKIVHPDQKTKSALLSLDDFHIELIQKQNSVGLDDMGLEDKEERICGFKNFGFKVDGFEDFFDYLKQKDVNFLSEITEGRFTSSRYFVVEDNDQNDLVFIENWTSDTLDQNSSGSSFSFTPRWTSIVVDDLESEVTWYEENLGFSFYRRLDYDGVQTRLLYSNNFILELKHFEVNTLSRDEVINETDTTSIQGFGKLTFKVEDIGLVREHMKDHDVELVETANENNPSWNTKSFLVHDVEDNLIQIVQY